jgi:hypothetical protein
VAELEPPPSYSVAASLPSYEQAEQLKEKLLEDVERQEEEEEEPARRGRRTDRWGPSPRASDHLMLQAGGL